VDSSNIEKYMPLLLEKLEGYSKEDLIKRFVASEFNKFMQYYQNSRDLNANERAGGNNRDDYGSRRKGRGDRRDRDDSNKQRFFVALGKKDGFNHGALLRLLCDNTGVSKGNIGKIDILDAFSFFDADKNQTETILSKMEGVDFEGNVLKIEKTKSRDGGKKSSSNNYGGDRSRRRSNHRGGNGERSRRRSYKN